MGKYPFSRNRILRSSAAVREMVAETQLHTSQFIAPLFVIEGENKKEEILSMPGYYRYSSDLLINEINELIHLGISAVLLFVKVKEIEKDNTGNSAAKADGLMQETVRKIKKEFPQLCVMTDVALDPYSTFGHDGIVEEGEIVNDKTVQALVKMALSHVSAGADWVAPSDMMDGRIGAIREAFNAHGFHDKGILAYSAKYASHLYGPFRDALDSAPGFGDKKTYQMDYRNVLEAIKESLMDIEEGADMVMVKPGIFYLDIVSKLKSQIHVPIAAYQVSGEYAMIKAAAEKGWLEAEPIIIESLMALRRAGASVIVTYFAKEAAQILKG